MLHHIQLAHGFTDQEAKLNSPRSLVTMYNKPEPRQSHLKLTDDGPWPFDTPLNPPVRIGCGNGSLRYVRP
jgi:hypothetical protein